MRKKRLDGLWRGLPARGTGAAVRKVKGHLREAGSRAGEGNPADAPALRYEVLIVENGSEDGTEFLARTLELEHPGAVRFLRSEKGVSMPATGGWKSKGTWVLFLDADDYLLEGRICP